MQINQKLAPALPIRQVNRRSGRFLVGLLATALLIPCEPVHAQPYPERSIKIVVPFSPGGPTDVVARLVAQSLSGRLGQSVVVENLAGAGGRIGAKAVATARPDGYTLLLGGTNINAIIGALYKDLGFDPINSFAPIGAICVDSMALAINPRVPANSLQQFVQYAKENPGKVKYGAPPGIYTQFAAEFFKLKTGTDILFVPYKGGAPAITDLLGGHIDMVFNPKSSLLSHFKEGKLRALAVTSESRWPELPDTPTMTEAGIAGFPTEVWFGLLAPQGTASSTVDKLNHAVNDAVLSAEMRAPLAKLGVEGKTGTPQAFAIALTDQARTWKAVVDATGVKGE
jgi:tripartite-type tricarboxylate transporter receptor subunit TctC